MIILLFVYLDHYEKVREHQNLAPIPAFSKRPETRICPNHNDTRAQLLGLGSVSLQFSLETRLESESFEPLIDFLAFLVQKL